jgi:hypothetical protein
VREPATRIARSLGRYLAGLRTAQRVLWCYLIWYLYVLARYFDPSPALWLSSLGISGIVGTALYISTARAGQTRVHLERWQIVRLYLMPFCVSSFAALIKGRGFVLVFHPSLPDNLLAASLCALFVFGTGALARTVTALGERRITPAGDHAGDEGGRDERRDRLVGDHS